MISNNAARGNPSKGGTGHIVVRVKPERFTLTHHGRHQLTAERGLTDEAINAAKIGSIRIQEDLDALGLDWDIDSLSSLLVIPYLNPNVA